MRRSELDPRLSGLAQRLLGSAGDVLAIGVTGGLGDRDVFVVDEPARALTQRRQFAALLFRVTADATMRSLRAALVSLRPLLVPGAVVLLAADKRAPALDQLRAVFAREPSPRAGLDTLCEAAVLSGLVAPRVHDAPGSRWLLVSAALPADPTALDVFFTQPPSDPSR